MGAFTFKLEHQGGTPADPPVFKTAVPTWRAGDSIPARTWPNVASSRYSASDRAGRRSGARSRSDSARVVNYAGTTDEAATLEPVIAPEEVSVTKRLPLACPLCGIGKPK
jgi:hypothetical protein